MKTCSTPECTAPVHARGYCSRCYGRRRTKGLMPRKRVAMRPREKGSNIGPWFKSVLVPTPGPLDTPCLVWPRQIGTSGYGKMTIDGRTVSTHRYAWELEHGPVPSKLQVNHDCDNKLCCNPDHMYSGTSKDNRQDAVRRRRIPVGEQHHNATLTASTVLEIRSLSALGLGPKEIMEKLQTPRGATQGVLHGKTWKHLL